MKAQLVASRGCYQIFYLLTKATFAVVHPTGEIIQTFKDLESAIEVARAMFERGSFYEGLVGSDLNLEDYEKNLTFEG